MVPSWSWGKIEQVWCLDLPISLRNEEVMIQGRLEEEDGVWLHFFKFKYWVYVIFIWMRFIHGCNSHPSGKQARTKSRSGIKGASSIQWDSPFAIFLIYFGFVISESLFHIYLTKGVLLTPQARGLVVSLLACDFKGVGSSLGWPIPLFFITCF